MNPRREVDAALDSLREREGGIGDLIARFDPEALAAAIRPRLVALGGPDGEALIELVEALASPGLLAGLADALAAQVDLAPDRLWQALDTLEGSGLIEGRPELLMLRDDLEEGLGGDPLDDLVAQIDDDPGSIAIAVEGLARIEPEVRAEIVAGLEGRSDHPAVALLLRRFSEGGDAARRSADLPARSEVATRDRPRPIRRSAVGPLDGDGRGTILILAGTSDEPYLVRCECDVREGIVAVGTREGGVGDDLDEAFDAEAGGLGADVARECPAVALSLLGAAAWLSGDRLAPESRHLLERVLGPGFAPAPIFADPGSATSAAADEAEGADDARLVLGRRPGWRDESPLLRRLAVEWRLRHGDAAPDLAHDPGPFRVLFEGRILGRVELYRRMLLWSALVWGAQGEADMAGSALRVAAQLGDPQNRVPGHPFLAALMARSLATGGTDLA